MKYFLYERWDYESVDEKNLSWNMYRKNDKKKIQELGKGLKK